MTAATERETFTAYKCTEDCGIQLNHAGAGCDCSCCESGWVQDAKGRYRCYVCNKFVKKLWDYSCDVCSDEDYYEAKQIQAYRCECGEIVEFDATEIECHEADSHTHEEYRKNKIMEDFRREQLEHPIFGIV